MNDKGRWDVLERGEGETEEKKGESREGRISSKQGEARERLSSSEGEERD